MKSGISLSDIDRMYNLICSKRSRYFEVAGQKRALSLFHAAAKRVPAYKDFLKKNKVNPDKIKTFLDFKLVSPVNKKNYLHYYPIEKLCWDGVLKKPLVWCATSGSTGEPFYFPRGEELNFQSAVYHEMFLRSDPESLSKSTLVIVGFGMGVWIGGLITYEAFKGISSSSGYPITILTTGTNKKEIFEALKRIGPKFDQIILCGYPPFIKDVIDEAKDQGIHWRRFHLKIVFAAETFSEKFRDYIFQKTGMENIYTDAMNIYGSADLGTMAEETPLSVLLRRIAVENQEIHKGIFARTDRLPTFVQFNPLFINFEEVNNEVLCTANSALPLIRYSIGDHGGVLSFKTIEEILRSRGIKLQDEISKFKLNQNISELPFVYIYDRIDLSTKLYGAIIYPEHVKEGLHQRTIEKFITGKFTMITKNDKKFNEYLEINMELKPGRKESSLLKKLIHDAIKENLRKRNAEYKYLSDMMPGRVNPRIIFWRYEHPLHFKPGIKQKWIKKAV